MKPTSLPTDPPRFAELEAAYELVRELGRGGTAVVYLARERELDRYVAIKVIRSTYVEDEEAAARLLREARTVAGLQHPNIVMLYGTKRLGDGSLALIMQYVPGRTLKSEIRRRGALPFDEATRILSDIARALSYAHHRRIVHRDIKPENIYLDHEAGIARLSDFGIARPWDADSNLTLPGAAIGTPTYMSPEQIDGGWIDGRSDIYSLGLVGWQMLTGTPPWAGETLFSTIFKQKNEELPPVERLRPDVPPSLAAALRRALSKHAEDRWPDGESLLAALGAPNRVHIMGPASTPVETDGEEESEAGETENPTIAWQRPDVGAAAAGADVAQIAAARAAARAAEARFNGTDASEEAPPPAGAARPADGRTPVPGVFADEAPIWRPDPRKRDQAERPRSRRLAQLAAAGVLLAAAAAAATLAGVTDRLGRFTGETPVDAEPQPVLTEPLRGEPGFAPGAATPGVPALMYPLSGAEQDGVAGDTLRDWLVVRVEDGSGRPAPDVAVRFSVASGPGSVEPVEAVTDSHGLAMARWVVNGAGAHEATASVADAGVTPAVFRAVIRPAAPAGAGARAANDPAGNDRAPGAGAAGSPRPEPAGTGAATRANPGTTPAGAAAPAPAASAPAPATARAAAPIVPIRSGVVSGGLHSCLLDGAGALACWGGNASGQLGDGSGGRSATPVRVSAPEPLARVAAGVSHSCAVGSSGAGWCWGANTAGQLGDGTRTQRNEPVRVRTDARLTSIVTGARHSCAVTSTGATVCWGDNAAGQLGNGSRDAQIEPEAVVGGHRFTTLTAGWEHTCGLTGDGRAFCWGRNGSGELGDGTTTDRVQPVAATSEHRFNALAAGNGFTCGLRADGVIFCWGQNGNGQLGRGGTTASMEALPVAAEQVFTGVAAGAVHACGLARDGTAHCWGRNNYGQVGDGTSEDRTRPTPVAGGRRFTSLSTVGSHTCAAMGGAGAAFCWGYNLEGQLGNATRTNSNRPVPVSRP